MNKDKAHEQEEEEEEEKLIQTQQKLHKKPTTRRRLLQRFSFFSSSSQNPNMDYSPPTDQSTSHDAVFSTTTAVAKSSSRRSPSFSSSSSSSSSHEEYHSPSFPTTPLHFSSGRIPFSWEKQPGIPKNLEPPSLNVTISDDSTPKTSLKVLPLPPPITPPARRFNFEDPPSSRIIRRASTFYSSSSSTRFVAPRDPFFAALVECSKGDDLGYSDDQGFLGGGGNGAKVTRSISDRFGLVGMYASCKRTCAVSESIVYLPRTSSPGRPSYDLLSRRR